MCSYYSKTVVYDAAGAELATVDNSLVCADYSVLAFGMRIDSSSIDNVEIREYEAGIKSVTIAEAPKTDYNVGDAFVSGGKLAVEDTDGKITNVSVTQDMLEGFDTSAEGEKEVKIIYRGFELTYKITVSAVAEETAAAEKTPAPADATEAPGDEEKSEGGCGSVIGGFSVIMLLLGAALVSKRH